MPFHIRKNEIGHRWRYAGLTVTGVAGALIALYLTGGNEHAAAKHPGIDTMPHYSVGPQQPGTGEKMPAQAHVTGATVCQKLVVIKHGDGSFEIIERPVLDEQKQIPLEMWSVTKDGPTFSQQQNAVDMTVYDLNGRPSSANALTGCDQEQLTTRQVQDASNGAVKPFVLAGPASTVQDGDVIPVTVGEAVNADLVHFDVIADTQMAVDGILSSLAQ